MNLTSCLRYNKLYINYLKSVRYIFRQQRRRKKYPEEGLIKCEINIVTVFHICSLLLRWRSNLIRRNFNFVIFTTTTATV